MIVVLVSGEERNQEGRLMKRGKEEEEWTCQLQHTSLQKMEMRAGGYNELIFFACTICHLYITIY